MVVVTLLFIGMYGAGLFGFVHPTADMTLITRLEPIAFIMIGYFFGRLPGFRHERQLRDELERQVRKIDAAIQSKEQIEIECEVMEEKIKNARIALAPLIDEASDGKEPATVRISNGLDARSNLRQLLHMVVKILEY